MYGTLDNKNNPQGNGDSAKQSADSFGNGRWLSDQEINRRKRIYSHCHVQADEDKVPKVDKSARRRLIAASVICLVFMVLEIAGGILSNSLAIATDAAHLLTDFASFMISLFAIWLSSRPATRKMSFGWYRAEVIGALLSVLMIWLVTGFLVFMAIERLRTKEFEIDSFVMVITASAGLLVNIIMAIALNVDGHGHSHGFHGHSHHHHHDHDHDHEESCEHEHLEVVSTVSHSITNGLSSESKKPNGATLPNGTHSSKEKKTKDLKGKGRGRSNINVRAAFIHVVGDFVQSLGVLVAALVIHFEPSYSFVDPICTFLFSLLVLVTTINIIRDAINVLMEGIPDGINLIEVREKLQELPSVIRVHNLRIWSLSMDKIAISTHLVIDDSRTPSQALKMAIDTLKSSYNFFEVTIQVEEYRDEMRDCQHCQNEEVVINVIEENQQAQ